jgi:hypothetical protein
VEGLSIGLKDKNKNLVVNKRVTDSEGRYRFIIQDGDYLLTIRDRQYRQLTNLESGIVKKEGEDYKVIGKDIVVERLSEKAVGSSSNVKKSSKLKKKT